MEKTSGAVLERIADEMVNTVSFSTDQVIDLRAPVLRLTPQSAAFELYNLLCPLRLSEVISDFKVLAGDATAYAGKAVVRSLVNLGTMTVCEVELSAPLMPVDLFRQRRPGTLAAEGFNAFLKRWQKHYRILPEYKVVIADMQSFLEEFRLWLDQIELGTTALPPEERLRSERAIVKELIGPAATSVSAMFERFEAVTATIPEESAPAHRAFCRRRIQPLVLSSPFALRAVKKPLGYAGDYELVSMILRDPHEGASLFGKVLNHWFIKQPPAEAHRNRIKYLTRKLVEETARVAGKGRTARVFNVGCGPAKEVQNFFAETELSNRAHFTLVDFNEETLLYATGVLEDARRRYQRRTSLEFVKKSAAQLLRVKKGEASSNGQFDLVYCAGLFDYLSDAVCRQLMDIYYGMLAPGGLLVATNVDASNPIRHWLGDILEWHLIYRDAQQFFALRPGASDEEWVRVQTEDTGVNIFLEVRKPPE